MNEHSEGNEPLTGVPPDDGQPEEATAPSSSPSLEDAPATESVAGAPEPELDDVLTLDDVLDVPIEEQSPANDVARQRDEYLDALRRLQADFENYKKRMLRQRTDQLERAGEDLVLKLLPVLDAVDGARAHGHADAVEPVAGVLLDVLGKEGLERLDPTGQLFDPNEHEAVSHLPSEDDGEPEVIEVLRAGYRWKGRVLRPAMVTVKG